jgi:hypothetical protein
MGMLFGGWAREEEEEVRDYWKGDWNAYRADKEARIAYAQANPVVEEYSSSKPEVTRNDIIGQWNNDRKEFLHEFHIRRILVGKIFGTYIDGRNDGQEIEWPHGDYGKVCSVMGEKL